MADKPKPCPWCGWHGDRIDVREGSTFRWMFPECPSCGATPGEERVIEQVPTGKPIDTPKNYAAALEMWNTRASPWQPIETAPKDGTRVLLLGRGEKHADGFFEKKAYAGNGCWVWPYVYCEPTRWQPLPEPPKD